MDLAGAGGFDGLAEFGNWREARAEDGIDLGNVGAVEQIEGFRHEIEVTRFAEGKIRRSSVTIRGVSMESRPKPSGRAASGKAPARLESKPVNGSTGRPLCALKIGATSMWLKARVSQP